MLQSCKDIRRINTRRVICADRAYAVLFIRHNTVLNDCQIKSAIRAVSPASCLAPVGFLLQEPHWRLPTCRTIIYQPFTLPHYLAFSKACREVSDRFSPSQVAAGFLFNAWWSDRSVHISFALRPSLFCLYSCPVRRFPPGI